MQKIFLGIGILTLLFSCNVTEKEPFNALDKLIPKPAFIQKQKGYFNINEQTVIKNTGDFTQTATYFKNSLKKLTGKTIKAAKGEEINLIIFRRADNNSLEKEGYELYIEDKKLIISANDPAGSINGANTLLQLIMLDSTFNIPCGIIKDQPKHEWRGFMLDVARQYYPREVIIKLIDALAIYKINTLHLHLTDDQGWRIEIDALPKLTEVGAIADSSFGDRSSGYYSKKDIRALIDYAEKRNITIVPEIDMPGHSRAAITSYPELSCFGGPGKMENRSNPRDGMPFTDPVCPGKENTYAFYEKVIKEVAELFPSEFIHIGGDETSKTTWKTCKACQAVMKNEKLKSVDNLQNYFAKRIQKIIESHGKKAIGWDELYETGAPPDFAIMAWREEQWGVEAANNGHEVVMAPCQYYYFNYTQVYDDERRWAVASPIHNVYKHNIPIPAHEKLLGIQACYWGGKDKEGTGDYMFESVFPRIIALAENGWSEKPKDYKLFLQRLDNHYNLLEKLNINYYIAHPMGLYDDVCYQDEYKVDLSVPISNANIHYTLDGSEPSANSPVYEQAFSVPIGTTIKAKTIMPNGRSSITITGTSKAVELMPAINPTGNPSSGLKATIYKGKIKKLKEKHRLTKIKDTIMHQIRYPNNRLKHDFALSFSGYIDIPANGVYSFYLNSSDGSNLYIDGDTAVSNDFTHPRLTIMKRIALEKGFHDFKLDYFYSSIFEKHLVLEMDGPEIKRQEIPKELFFH